MTWKGAVLALAVLTLTAERLPAGPPETTGGHLSIWSGWKDSPVKSDFIRRAVGTFARQHGVDTDLVIMNRWELMGRLAFDLEISPPDLTYVDIGFTDPRIVRSFTELSDFHLSDFQSSGFQSLGGVVTGWGPIRLESEGKGMDFLPIEGSTPAIFYNRELFRKAGITPPADRPPTDREFLDMVRQLRRAGITPIGEGSPDHVDGIGKPLLYTMFRYAGPEKMEQLRQGRITFSDPDIFAALRFWKQVVDAGAYDANSLDRPDLREGISEVVEGRAAMCLGGSWIYGKFASTEWDQGGIGVMDWFTASDGKGNGLYEVEWVGGFAISRNSPRRELALDFLRHLLTPALADRWNVDVQAPYPLAGSRPPPDSLAEELARQRVGQKPSPVAFSHWMYQTVSIRWMWKDATYRFITEKHSVDEFIQRMNSRLPR